MAEEEEEELWRNVGGPPPLPVYLGSSLIRSGDPHVYFGAWSPTRGVENSSVLEFTRSGLLLEQASKTAIAPAYERGIQKPRRVVNLTPHEAGEFANTSLTTSPDVPQPHTKPA